MALLQDAAQRAGGRTADRLAEVHALLSVDMAAIEAELGRMTRDGVTPATDSAVHLLEGGGKRVRPMTVLLAASCFGAQLASGHDQAGR